MPLTINEVDRGANALLNNLHLYRVYFDQRTILNRESNGDIDTTTSEFRIFFKQYYKDTNDDIIMDTYREMYYRVMDVPGFPNLTNRLDQLWRTPINGAAPGIGDAIEAVLAALPFDVEQGYILNT